MKIKICLFLTCIIGFTACGKLGNAKYKNVVTFNDFESTDGWNEKAAGITNEKTYSGRFSLKVDKKIEYSLGFNKTLGEISLKKPKKIKLEAWAYVPSKETGAAILTFIIDNPQGGGALLWDGIKLAEEVKVFKDWTHIEKEINLPDNIQVNHTMVSYLWRSGASEPVYIDDVKITLVE